MAKSAGSKSSVLGSKGKRKEGKKKEKWKHKDTVAFLDR
jgi:hypothetical protein